MKSTSEVWTAILPPPYVEHLTNRVSQYPSAPATIGGDGGFVEDNSFRRSVIRWLDPRGADHDIATLMMKYVNMANRSLFGFDITTMNDIQFTEYHADNAGHYDWHQDVWWENPDPYDRKISIVIQMSDPADYEGGLFEFKGAPNPGDRFMPQGSIIVFPSFMPHRVTPVTRGTRKSLVSWIEGPKFR